MIVRAASAPYYENREKKRSEYVPKPKVPPPNKPAPLAKSESMKESSALTSRYSGPDNSNRGQNCAAAAAQVPFPLPSERDAAASTTIKNEQQQQQKNFNNIYHNTDSNKEASQGGSMDILDYDHTLRAIGSCLSPLHQAFSKSRNNVDQDSGDLRIAEKCDRE